MLPETKKAIERMIERAKALVVKSYEGSTETKREWLECHVDSYRTDQHRVVLFALEGSPIKGYVIANYGTGTVIAFGVHDRRLRTFRLSDEN